MEDYHPSISPEFGQTGEEAGSHTGRRGFDLKLDLHSLKPRKFVSYEKTNHVAVGSVSQRRRLEFIPERKSEQDEDYQNRTQGKTTILNFKFEHLVTIINLEKIVSKKIV